VPFRRISGFHSPSPPTPLWRHVRLSQLLSLIDRRALWFTALSELEDKFEGAYTERDMRRLQQLERLTTRAKGAPELLVPLDLRNRLTAIRARVYVSCWYAGDEESAALWLRSARDTDFVAIQTTFRDLRTTIRQTLPAAYVRYLDYGRQRIPAGTVLTPFFCKRRIFEHEHEFRIVVYGPEVKEPPPGHYVRVSPQRLIRQVMLAPYTQTWVGEAIRAVLRRYGITAPVVRSAVDAGPTW
jgi:hypothetical protein